MQHIVQQELQKALKQQQVEGLEGLYHALFLYLFPCLFQAEEGEEVQPVAVPNEEEDGYIEEQVEEQEKDHHNQSGVVVVAATVAGLYASYEHGVECGGDLDYPKCVVHVQFAVQQIGYVEECWVGFDPCIRFEHQQRTIIKKIKIKNIHGSTQQK